jgi:GntR family transcriptional regulator
MIQKSMQIKLDFRTGIPIYVQIIEQIKHLVETGVLRPGDQLPTVRQLAADLRVNFNTVARAYRLLDEAGIISTQHGRGTYILDDSTHEYSQVQRTQALEEITRQYLADAAHLEFTPEEVERVFLQYLRARHSKRAPEKGTREP